MKLLWSQEPASPPSREDPSPIATGRQIDGQRKQQIARPCHQEHEAAVEQTTIRENRTCHDEHIGWDGGEQILDRRTGAYQQIQDLDGKLGNQAQQAIDELMQRGLAPGTNAGVERVDVTDLIEQGDRRYRQSLGPADPAHAFVGLSLYGHGVGRDVKIA